jgi:hypothetical protein
LASTKDLKDAVLNELLVQVRDGITVKDDEGNVTKLSPSPAILKVALDYVKTFEADEIPATGELSKKLAQYTKAQPVLVRN